VAALEKSLAEKGETRPKRKAARSTKPKAKKKAPHRLDLIERGTARVRGVRG